MSVKFEDGIVKYMFPGSNSFSNLVSESGWIPNSKLGAPNGVPMLNESSLIPI